jgi:putative transposase
MRKVWRGGGILNRAQYPSDVIALVIFWRLRYELSLRNLPKILPTRGIEFSHEAVRDWKAKLTPTLIDNLRRRRKGRIGKSWCVDETYIKVNGRWCCLYRAIDRSDALVDVKLSQKRDVTAAKAFVGSAKAVTGVTPLVRVTTDGHDSYPRAIQTELNPGVKHRTNQSLNNRIEQDHRAIQGRYGPMCGFKVASPRRASVDVSTNSVITRDLVRVAAGAFQPTAATIAFWPVGTSRSAFWKRPDHR